MSTEPKQSGAPGGIFVSYRRTDAYAVDALFERLTASFGASALYRDVYFAAGADWPDLTRKSIAACDVVLAVVGTAWFGREGTKDSLASEDDELRIELELAAALDKPVVPVVLQGAAMPGVDALPPSLRWFAERQASMWRSGPDARSDYEHLKQALVALAPRLAPSSPAKPARRPAGRLVAVGGLVALLVVAAGAFFGYQRYQQGLAQQRIAAEEAERHRLLQEQEQERIAREHAAQRERTERDLAALEHKTGAVVAAHTPAGAPAAQPVASPSPAGVAGDTSPPKPMSPRVRNPRPKAAPAVEFDGHLATVALEQQRIRARDACGKQPGARGYGVMVSVRFEPTGRVLSAAFVQGDARLNGTPLGECYLRHLRGARIAPFIGSARAVGHMFGLL